MAVDLIQLAAALRLGDGVNAPTEPVAGLLSRLLLVSQDFVEIASPDAPEHIKDEAAIRLTATLFDSPTAASGDRYAAAWRNSGAENLVSRWVVRRAGSEGEGVPNVGPTTGGLDDDQVRAIVDEVLAAHADLETAHHTPPEGGGDGTDQTARDAAAANTEAATAHADDANAHHTPPTGGEGVGDDAYDWATVGNDLLLVPTDKVNLSGVQNQIDEIVDQIAHSEGTINAVVGVLGAGSASLRYTIPIDLDGLYDVSVRVKARVQVNEFANISGNLHIIEDGGLGLNSEIPEAVHNYHHAHEGVFNFIRKGLSISPGASQINFTTLVTGASPPDVHFIDVMNMTITPTPATPTPPTVLVDGAAYTAHGDVTVAGWRDYDFVQLFYAVGGTTYMTPPVNTVQLIAFTSLIVPVGRNVEWTLSIDAADDDVITTAQSASGNAVAAPTATSTITVIAWRAG